MLEHRSRTRRRQHPSAPPFPRIVCGVDGGDTSAAAISQAIAIAGADGRIAFAAAWYGRASRERAIASDEHAREAAEHAVEQARACGVQASALYFHAPRLADALLASTELHDLVVVGAHPHARPTGIVLGEAATLLVHRCSIPVLVARERPLEAGVVAATRGLPADRIAVSTAARLAARLGAELTIVHVPERRDDERRAELSAELADARALLGRSVDQVDADRPPTTGIVFTAESDGAGLVVVGSDCRQGLPAVRSVSERVAHLAPCSVLVMR